LGSSSGTPFFSWMIISPPSRHDPLMVLPSSLLPWILPASIAAVAWARTRWFDAFPDETVNE
jgi:hypothetical protein